MGEIKITARCMHCGQNGGAELVLHPYRAHVDSEITADDIRVALQEYEKEVAEKFGPEIDIYSGHLHNQNFEP